MTYKYLEPLFTRRERPVPSVLSIYLDTDESKEINLNRGFEKHLKDITGSIRRTITDPAEAERFATAASHISDFLSVYKVHARGLAMFYDAADGFFWHDELNVATDTQVRWDRELFLQPLAGALDEFERYGVVLLDHANMRLFRMFLGSIEEVAHRHFSRKAVQHIKSVGLDHLGSANTAQRRADENVRINLRHMIKDIDALVQSEHVEHLVLAGTPEMTSELRDLLPKRLELRVVGAIVLPFEASPGEVLAGASRLAEEYERSGEAITVREVMTAAAKNGKAVAGLARTLNAVNHGRVWQLIYSAGFRPTGFECTKCAALVTLERSECAYCGGRLRAVHDVVERAVEHALRSGARIEVVKGEASAALKGGIAAFLKARTASVQM
jgi:peptide chain release factor subunit 1